MASKGTVSLNLHSTANEKLTKNLPNVNPALLPVYSGTPDATAGAKLARAARALNSLTTNSLLNINVIATVDITAEEV